MAENRTRMDEYAQLQKDLLKLQKRVEERGGKRNIRTLTDQLRIDAIQRHFKDPVFSLELQQERETAKEREIAFQAQMRLLRRQEAAYNPRSSSFALPLGFAPNTTSAQARATGEPVMRFMQSLQGQPQASQPQTPMQIPFKSRTLPIGFTKDHAALRSLAYTPQGGRSAFTLGQTPFSRMT